MADALKILQAFSETVQAVDAVEARFGGAVYYDDAGEEPPVKYCVFRLDGEEPQEMAHSGQAGPDVVDISLMIVEVSPTEALKARDEIVAGLRNFSGTVSSQFINRITVEGSTEFNNPQQKRFGRIVDFAVTAE